MGARGSGRRLSRQRVEHAVMHDLARFPCAFEPGGICRFSAVFKRGDEQRGELTIEVDLSCRGSEHLRVRGTAQTGGSEIIIAQSVTLVRTPARVGGQRRWIRCPIGRQRTRTLVLPEGGNTFIGRRAAELGYESQLSKSILGGHRKARQSAARNPLRSRRLSHSAEGNVAQDVPTPTGCDRSLRDNHHTRVASQTRSDDQGSPQP